MLPRLRSAYFGLLDDAVTLYNAPPFWNDPIKILYHTEASGRFFPSYLAFYTIAYQFAGRIAGRWYLVMLTLLAVNSVLIYQYVHQRGAQKPVAFLSALFFILSAPVFESYYTISKTEPQMLVWILAAMNLGIYFTRVSRPLPKVLIFTGMIFFFLLSFTTKETAIIMIPVCFGWLVISLIYRKNRLSANIKSRGILFLSSMIAGVVLFILRELFIPFEMLGTGSYSSLYTLDLVNISNQALRWLGRIVRDYIFLFPLLSILFKRSIRQSVQIDLLAESVIWMIGWVAILLPWRVLDLYHTLPFSFGAATLSAIVVWAAIQEVVKPDSQRKIYAWGVLMSSFGLGIMVLVNNWMIGQIQITYDRQNWLLIEFLSDLPQGSQIFINIPNTEYVYETRLYLNQIMGRPDLGVNVMDYQPPAGNGAAQFYVVLPIFKNDLHPAVRTSINALDVQIWNTCFEDFQSEHAAQIYRQVEERQRVDFGFNRLLPKLRIGDLLSIGENISYPFFWNKKLRYGWSVYEINLDMNKIARPGYFEDGKWRLLSYKNRLIELDFGQPGDLPVTGDWDGDGYDEIGVYRPSTHTWMFDHNMDGQADDSRTFGDRVEGLMPVAGDWDGDGIDDPGFRHPTGGWELFDLSDSEQIQIPLIYFGAPGDMPIAGDWNGDGRDSIGVYQPTTGAVFLVDNLSTAPEVSYEYTLQSYPRNALIYAADWYGTGKDFIAIVDGDTWLFHPTHAQCSFPSPVRPLKFEAGEGIPFGGAWEEPGSVRR